MARIKVSIDINAGCEEVFDAATDLASWPDRIEAITRVEVLGEGPVGEGTVFRETRMMFGREATEEMTIATFERPHRYVTNADSCGCDYVSTTTFTPTPEGTRMTLDFRGRPRTLVARLMTPIGWLFTGALRRCVVRDFENMKAHIESAGADRS